MIVGLFTAFFLALATVTSRKLKSVPTEVIMFNHMGVGILMAYILILIEDPVRKRFVYEDKSTYLLLFVAAIANCAAMNMW